MTEYIWPKIKKDTTIEELKEIHRRIWDYALTHTFVKPMTPYLANCVACEYVFLNNSKNLPFTDDFCAQCPIKWPHGIACPNEDSLFDMFLYHRQLSMSPGYRKRKDLCHAVEFAERIRDVEWKDDRP